MFVLAQHLNVLLAIPEGFGPSVLFGSLRGPFSGLPASEVLYAAADAAALGIDCAC